MKWNKLAKMLAVAAFTLGSDLRLCPNRAGGRQRQYDRQPPRRHALPFVPYGEHL